MIRKVPRVLIAGTSSGSGKTTAVCAILSLMKRRGIHAASCKCGPDYIDPMFHQSVLGIDCTNLDPFFCGGNLLRYLLAENSGEITVVEGVMGYYDGTGADGLLLPGGYPELYAEKLAVNDTAKSAVRAAIASGMPTIAECGGFQYLGVSLDGHPMGGVLPHESVNTGKLVCFGYITLTSHRADLFGAAGTTLRGHEFHYWDSTDCGKSYTAEKTNGKVYDCVVSSETLYAGYPQNCVRFVKTGAIPAVCV